MGLWCPWQMASSHPLRATSQPKTTFGQSVTNLYHGLGPITKLESNFRFVESIIESEIKRWRVQQPLGGGFLGLNHPPLSPLDPAVYTYLCLKIIRILNVKLLKINVTFLHLVIYTYLD